MSLDRLETQIGELRARADGIQKQWSRDQKSIAADKSLSDLGKQQKLDSAREQVRAKLLDLRQQENGLISAETRSLEKSLFGLGPAASCDAKQLMLYRDAQDRAARLTQKDEAQRVFASAVRSEDKTLAAAVLAQAISNGWRDIIAEYVKENPRAGDDIDALRAIQQYEPMAASLAYLAT
jgi:hypothetical protein